MNKNALNNNTSKSVGVGMAVTLALGNLLQYYFPEPVAVMGAVNVGVILTGAVAFISRQLKYYFVERGQKAEVRSATDTEEL